MSNMHTKERMAPPLRRKLQPPGPRGHLFGNARDLERDPLGFLLELVHMYGDAVRLRLLMWPMYLINHPDDIQQVLQRNAHNYSKDTFDYRILVPFLGKGLLTNDGTSWLHQRRLIQPAFHRQRLATYGTFMSKATEAMLARWEPLAGRGAALDVAAEMRQLTLRIVGFALFSLDLEAEATTVGQAFTTVNTLLTDFPTLIVPTLRNRRLRAAARKLDPVVYDIITSRRKREADDEDLLSLLLVARDEETGKGMSDEQLHDEVLTLLLAGYETTANALSWTWYLLARHPAVEAHLHAELECDAGRAPPDGRRLVPSAIQSHGD